MHSNAGRILSGQITGASVAERAPLRPVQDRLWDSFVRGPQTGGEFYAVVRITSVSTSTQTQLAAQAQAALNGLIAN
jgi:hypothetical protein